MSKLERFIYDHEGLFIFSVIAAFVAGAIIVIAAGTYSAQVYACDNLQRLTRLETDVTLTLGCMVKYQGQWVDADVVTKRHQEVTLRAGK